MKCISLPLFLSVIGSVVGEEISFGYGDKFGDGWNGAKLAMYEREYNSSYVVTQRDFEGVPEDYLFTMGVGEDGEFNTHDCDPDYALYFAMVYGENNTMLVNQDAPMQAWEIYYQVSVNDIVYGGGWNTLIGITCDENHTILDFTENLVEATWSCPECRHPKPKPKPKPQDRRLGASDDDRSGPKGKKPIKYWPVPVKLMDPTDQDGWFIPGSNYYAEYTISDASRTNLLAQGTLCASKGSDGYKTVCETMLPDGHYIFRASGHLDESSANYTWQLCGKEAIKYEVGTFDPSMNETMQYDYKSATGRMGSEASFYIKKGKCTVDEIVTLEDYVNGTALDAVLTLEGHLLLENVHFTELSAVESSFLEADINEFVSLEIEKTVSLTSVEDVNDGTLVGYNIIATHAESQLMHGTMDQVIETAVEQLQSQMSGGGFVSFLKNGLQNAGLADDKLMSVDTVSFVDLDLDHMVTLRNGETVSGDIIAGGDHSSVINVVVSEEDSAAAHTVSASDLVKDILTASGAFAVVVVMIVVVVVALKPAEVAAPVSEIDNSCANLVKSEEGEAIASLDVSSTDLLSPPREEAAAFSYEDSLSAALTQRWEMNTDDAVRL